MGNVVSKTKNAFSKEQNEKYLMFGLDNSGKTVALCKLKFGEVVTPIPTLSYNAEVIEYRKVNHTIYDIGWLFHKYKYIRLYPGIKLYH